MENSGTFSPLGLPQDGELVAGTSDKRRELLKDLRLAPAWMHPIFRELAQEGA